MSSNYSEVQKWAYSRRIQHGEAFDINGENFLVTTSTGRKIQASVSRGLDRLEMIDFLPVLVTYKNTSHGYVILDYELEDHPFYGDNLEQQDLDSYMAV